MNARICISVAIVSLCLLSSSAPVEGRRRRGGGGRGRNRESFLRLRPEDWFESTEEAGCDNPPGDNGGGEGDAGGNEGEGEDGGVAVGGGDGATEVERYVSGINICQDAVVGETKCVCIRKRFFFFFRQDGFRLKCGSCQMTFVSNRRRGNGGSEQDTSGALISIDDDIVGSSEEEEEAGDSSSEENFSNK